MNEPISEHEQTVLNRRIGGLAIYALLTVLLLWHWSVTPDSTVITRPTAAVVAETAVFVGMIVMSWVASLYVINPETVIDD